MDDLKLNPGRDAGRFAYHLKFLLKADLIEPDTKTKKYRLTELGRMLVNVTESIEEHAFKRRKMMVRTSRLAVEEFDRNKIAESLVKEANAPQELAQKIARETEARLVGVKTKYLTAPLIREFVNAILIEEGLEEYRHKLTRLGLPVYDVTQLIKSAGAKSFDVETVHVTAGNRVIEEYTLLNVLPRDIADAHLYGSLHLSNLDVWVLKPNEFMHDLRYFFKNGLSVEKLDLMAISTPPPKSLESALSTTLNLLRIAATEVSGEQLFDFFNVFLAPFAKGISRDQISETLRLFIRNVNQSIASIGSPIQVSLGLELTVPDFLAEKEAFGPSGNKVGFYTDFTGESQLLASLLLEILLEENKQKPVFQPSLIVKIRPEVFQSKEGESLLYQAHQLASEKGLPYFANLCPTEQVHAAYTATGCRLSNEWKEDWELDTLRTSSLDSVLINLPRVAYDSGNMTSFYAILDEKLEMALRAMEIKYYTIKQRVRENLLPFLSQKTNGDQYARFENSTRLIGFVGLSEAVEALSGQFFYNDVKALGLVEEIVNHVYNGILKTVRKPETRPVLAMVPSIEASKRLAQLDVERYGWARVRVGGTKEQPSYTDLIEVLSKSNLALEERLKIEEKFHRLTTGGHLTVLPLMDVEQNLDALMSITKRVATTSKIGLFAYSRNLTYCTHCMKTVFGHPLKCPSCDSVETLIYYSRQSAKYSADSSVI
jgi:ribonucleoside-triphosphate reductase